MVLACFSSFKISNHPILIFPSEPKYFVINFNSINFDKGIPQLIAHFKANGFNGNVKPKMFALIGAQDGCGYIGNNINIEIYRFDAASKIPTNLIYRNGNFGMMIHKGDANQINKVFSKF